MEHRSFSSDINSFTIAASPPVNNTAVALLTGIGGPTGATGLTGATGSTGFTGIAGLSSTTVDKLGGKWFLNMAEMDCGFNACVALIQGYSPHLVWTLRLTLK